MEAVGAAQRRRVEAAKAVEHCTEDHGARASEQRPKGAVHPGRLVTPRAWWLTEPCGFSSLREDRRPTWNPTASCTIPLRFDPEDHGACEASNARSAEGRVYYTTDGGQKSGLLPGIIVGGVFLSSSAYGFVVTSRCQEAKKYWAAHKAEEIDEGK